MQARVERVGAGEGGAPRLEPLPTPDGADGAAKHDAAMTGLGLNAMGRRYPLITIAIPTFNRASLLAACVKAALAQTYPHFEVLVSDNASTDDTPDVLSGIADTRLRVLRQDRNIGLLANWNACLAGAQGEYVIVVSDDDTIDPEMLERCARVLDGKARIPVVVALSRIHSAGLGQTRPARRSRALTSGVLDGIDVLLQFLRDRITVTMCSVMVRTDALRARGGFRAELPYMADVGAWAPLLLLGKAGFVNDACATYCIQDKSETARLSIERRLDDGRKVVDLISRLADRHVPDAARRDLLGRESRRCFARRGLIVLSDYRRSGAGLKDVGTMLWRFRSDLRPVNIAALVRFAAIVLCPRPLADRLRRMRAILGTVHVPASPMIPPAPAGSATSLGG